MTDKINFVTQTSVATLEERKERVYISGIGDNAVFEEKSLGWFVWLKGSYESLHLGMENPGWKVGDQVKITIERM